MTTDEKLAHMQKLDPEAATYCIGERSWLVRHRAHISVGTRGMLSKGGRGATPEQAIEGWWNNHVTELPYNSHIILSRFTKKGKYKEKHYVWRETDWERIN